MIGRTSSPAATGDAEARFRAALAAALERSVARAEPVSVVIAVAPSDDHARVALDAGRGELPPEGLAVPLGRGRLGLLLPAIALADARARAARLASACPGAACGVAVAGQGAPVGPDALLAEAEAAALGAAPPPRDPVREEVGSEGESC